MEHYKQCGEYLIAAKAKGKSELGSKFRWGEWLKENFGKSPRIARRNMQLSECWEKMLLQEHFSNEWEKISTHGKFSENTDINSALKLLSIQPKTRNPSD